MPKTRPKRRVIDDAAIHELVNSLWSFFNLDRDEWDFNKWQGREWLSDKEVAEIKARSEEFRHTWEVLEVVQRARVVYLSTKTKPGGKGRRECVINPAIAKTILQCLHGYTARASLDVNADISAEPRLPATPEECESQMRLLGERKNYLAAVYRQALALEPGIVGG